MSFLDAEKRRRVIPRWRDSRTTAETGELDSLTSGPGVLLADQDFQQALWGWEHEPTTATAAELVGAAIVLGREDEAKEAAAFVLDSGRMLSRQVQSLAEQVMGLGSALHGTPDRLDASEEDGRRRIHQLRERLKKDPRNALAWVDLAREYAIKGLHTKSKAAMETAVKLAPSSRFVLRSSARLFVHRDEPDKARGLLLRQAMTRYDPWLLAAEIAVAMVAGRTSQFIKQGKGIIASRNFAPEHVAELASALGTVELISGNSKEARKLFRQSLQFPTDNAVAQAVWAARWLGDLSLEPQHLEAPRSFEARAWKSYWSWDWDSALQQCQRWLADEPYSSRPAVVGSFVASVALQDFAAAEQMATEGLKANPGDATLLNNLAFALASNNRITEAGAELDKVNRGSLEGDTKIVVTATEGLLCFREGKPDSGRALYEGAIEEAASSQEWRLQALAITFLAREEQLAHTAQAPAAIARAKEECRRQNDGMLDELMKRVLSNTQ